MSYVCGVWWWVVGGGAHQLKGFRIELRSVLPSTELDSHYILAFGERSIACVCVCLCSSAVTVVQKLNRVQVRVMMHQATVDYNNQQSLAGQLVSGAIIFPILRELERVTELN